MGWYNFLGWEPKKVLKSCFGRRKGMFRSKKICVCGRHSSKDVKKNKHHNSTKQRLNHKIEREFAERIKHDQSDMPPEFRELVNEKFWDLL